MALPYERQPGESAKAYAAFVAYDALSPHERSIDAAWRESAPKDHQKRAHTAPRHWHDWSSQFEWVKRAAAHDDAKAEQDRQLIEARRREQRELEWGIVKRGLEIVRDALPNAEQFITRKTTTIRGTPSLMDASGNIIRAGTPDREIVTLQFDVGSLSAASERFGKQGRLANEQPTERIELSGAALDAYAASLVAQIIDGGQTSGGDAPATEDGDA